MPTAKYPTIVKTWTLAPQHIKILNPPVPALNLVADTSSPVAVGAKSVQFYVTFNEAVSRVNGSDFALTGINSSGTITSIMGSGANYVVSVNSVSGTGNIGLALSGSIANIVDSYGRSLSGYSSSYSAHDYVLSNLFYWDGNGLTSLGGSGSWNTGANWRVGSATGPLHGWVSGVNTVFSSATGTVTLATSATAASIQFNVAATIDLDGQSLTTGVLSGSGIITNNGINTATLTYNGGTSTFSGTLQNGSSHLALSVNAGSLTLSGTNTYTGGTTCYFGGRHSEV